MNLIFANFRAKIFQYLIKEGYMKGVNNNILYCPEKIFSEESPESKQEQIKKNSNKYILYAHIVSQMAIVNQKPTIEQKNFIELIKKKQKALKVVPQNISDYHNLAFEAENYFAMLTYLNQPDRKLSFVIYSPCLHSGFITIIFIGLKSIIINKFGNPKNLKICEMDLNDFLVDILKEDNDESSFLALNTVRKAFFNQSDLPSYKSLFPNRIFSTFGLYLSEKNDCCNLLAFAKCLLFLLECEKQKYQLPKEYITEFKRAKLSESRKKKILNDDSDYDGPMFFSQTEENLPVDEEKDENFEKNENNIVIDLSNEEEPKPKDVFSHSKDLHPKDMYSNSKDVHSKDSYPSNQHSKEDEKKDIFDTRRKRPTFRKRKVISSIPERTNAKKVKFDNNLKLDNNKDANKNLHQMDANKNLHQMDANKNLHQMDANKNLHQISELNAQNINLQGQINKLQSQIDNIFKQIQNNNEKIQKLL